MIPSDQLSRPAVGQLIEYSTSEITRALSDRRQLEERWIKYQRMYRAAPEVQQKEFPFLGAANLVVPLIATDVDIIFSRLMGILFTPENLWSCRPLRPDMVEYAPRLQEFMQWAQTRELDAYDATADFILEMVKLGTGIMKQRYKRQTKRLYEYRETPMGITDRHEIVTIDDHPILQHVSLYDFLIPATAIKIQDAPWVAERIKLTWAQLQQRARAGIYTNVDNLSRSHANFVGSQIEQVRMGLDRYKPGLGDSFECWEVWTEFDINGIGEPVAIVATIHIPSNTILRVDYNPFFHQEKPYSSARFMRQEKRFYGIGLAEMLEMPQEEITSMHNQRLDNATLANSTMFKAKKGIGIRQDEPVFPGRWFLLDQLEDVQPMPMGQRFDSTVPYEQLTHSYATNRTGVNDVIMGNPTPAIGYGALGTNVMVHQEAAKRFDQTLREIRVALSESGTRLVELYQQFNQNGKPYQVMGDKEGEVVQQVLDFPLELIRFGIGVDVTASSATLNKETEIRTNTIIMQLTMQFYQQMLQGMQLVLNPQLPQEMRAMAMQMMNGANTIMRRLLDSYGIQDVDVLIPQIQELLNGNQQQINTFGQAIGAGNGVPAGPGAPPGMAALPPGSQGAYSAAIPATAGF